MSAFKENPDLFQPCTRNYLFLDMRIKMTRLLGIKKWIVSDSKVSGIANLVREHLYRQFLIRIRGQEGFKMLQSVVSCPTQPRFARCYCDSLRRAPDPRQRTPGAVVGLWAFFGSLHGLELVPAKWCSLVPSQAAHASRWAVIIDGSSNVRCASSW